MFFSPIFLAIKEIIGGGGGGSGVPTDYEHYYTFANLSGASIVDESATTNMTEVNTLTNIIGPDGVTNGRQGNGTDDYIDTTMATNDWVGKSISMWVYSTDWGSSTVRFLYSDGVGGIEAHFGGTANTLRLIDPTSIFDYSTTTAGLVNGEWAHFVFYLASGSPSLYVNGVLQSGTPAGGASRINSANVQLLRRTDNNYYAPYALAHIYIYNRQLTTNEISSLANVFNVGSVSYVGGISDSFVSTNGTTIDLSGISMQQDDVVVLYMSTVGPISYPTISTSGYTNALLSTSANVWVTTGQVHYKVMGATPDTSVSITGQGSSSGVTNINVLVYRGLDTTHPFSQIHKKEPDNINTLLADPDPITLSSGSTNVTYVVGVNADPSENTYTSGDISNFVPQATYNVVSGYTAVSGIGYDSNVSGGLIDHGAVGYTGTDSTSSTYIAIESELAPAGSNLYGIYLDNKRSTAASIGRTNITPTDSTKFTLSIWFKLNELGFFKSIWGTNSTWDAVLINGSNQIRVFTAQTLMLETSGLNLQTDTWYHLVIAGDTSQTGTDKLKIWLDNTLITSFSTDSRSTFAGTGISTGTMYWGGNPGVSLHSGSKGVYFSNMAFTDGTPYIPTNFSSGGLPISDLSGLSFGSNGCHIKCENSDILIDSSGSSAGNFTTNTEAYGRSIIDLV